MAVEGHTAGSRGHSGRVDSVSGYELDARRLLCPMPVIRTQDRIKQLMDGDELTVYASDPGALHDIPTWSRIHGHEVLETRRDDESGDIVVRVRVKR